MNEKAAGLYQKFLVRRLDGRSRKGQKHHKCKYFCLDLTHDKFAVPALRAYATACEKEYPNLAEDLLDRVFMLENKMKEAYKWAISSEG